MQVSQIHIGLAFHSFGYYTAIIVFSNLTQLLNHFVTTKEESKEQEVRKFVGFPHCSEEH